MDIGEDKKKITVEPAEDPVPSREPAPAPTPERLPEPAEPTPAKTRARDFWQG
jgi:hypothetical protein